MRNFLDDLFVKIPKESKDEFEREVTLNSLKNSAHFLNWILLIEIIVTIVSFVPMSKPLYGTFLKYYRGMYFLLIAMVIFYIILFRNISKHKTIKTKKLQNIILFHILSGLIWSAGISIIDQIYNREATVYLTFIVAIALVVYIKPKLLLIVYGLVQVFFVSMRFIINGTEAEVFASTLNTSVFIVIGWVIERHLYKNRLENFIKTKIIEEKNLELKRANEKLETISCVDSLTNLYNRRKLDIIIDEQWKNAINENIELFIVMIDIDYFKKYNDTYGHIAGDGCIIQISNVLKDFCEDHSGFAARYGGDEFCLVLPGIQKSTLIDEIMSLKSKVRNLEMLNELSPIDKYVTISIGIYNDSPKKDIKPWSFVVKADQELYKNKLKREF